MRRSFSVLSLLAAVVVGVAIPAVAADAPKVTIEELIAKHVASLGTPEALAANPACGIEASAKFAVTLGGAGEGAGTLRMASEAQKLRMVMKFNTPNYMGEDLVNDGSKANVSVRVAGKPSLLSQFFFDRQDLLKEGLFGGALTSGWVFLDPKAPQLRWKYNGLKKIDGRDLHELQYETRKNLGEIQIRIYLDPETYRHVMTTYEASMKAQTTNVTTTRGRSLGNLASQESRIRLKEQFGDFRPVDGIMLPSSWTIKMTGDLAGATELTWTINVQDLMHAEIDAATFKTK